MIVGDANIMPSKKGRREPALLLCNRTASNTRHKSFARWNVGVMMVATGIGMGRFHSQRKGRVRR